MKVLTYVPGMPPGAESFHRSNPPFRTGVNLSFNTCEPSFPILANLPEVYWWRGELDDF